MPTLQRRNPDTQSMGIRGHWRKAIWLGGATATGKSAVAVALAEVVGGEIISVDSMQVYRGLDLGTAKPSRADRARIRHHLLDVVEVWEGFSVGRFVELAEKAGCAIREGGKAAILCGGTGLYFKALLEGLGELPAAEPWLRSALEASPLAELLVELQRSDPETYNRIDRQNARRVVRAVEVIRLSGGPVGWTRASWTANSTTEVRPRIFALRRQAEDLRRRIEERVEAMFRNGLVEETRRLLAQGLDQHRTALQAIGYRQVVEHLRGGPSLAETVDLVKQRTWQFARRQRLWFERQLSAEWVDVAPDEGPAVTASRILEACAAGGSDAEKWRAGGSLAPEGPKNS